MMMEPTNTSTTDVELPRIAISTSSPDFDQ